MIQCGALNLYFQHTRSNYATPVPGKHTVMNTFACVSVLFSPVQKAQVRIRSRELCLPRQLSELKHFLSPVKQEVKGLYQQVQKDSQSSFLAWFFFCLNALLAIFSRVACERMEGNLRLLYIRHGKTHCISCITSLLSWIQLNADTLAVVCRSG